MWQLFSLWYRLVSLITVLISWWRYDLFRCNCSNFDEEIGPLSRLSRWLKRIREEKDDRFWLEWAFGLTFVTSSSSRSSTQGIKVIHDYSGKLVKSARPLTYFFRSGEKCRGAESVSCQFSILIFAARVSKFSIQLDENKDGLLEEWKRLSYIQMGWVFDAPCSYWWRSGIGRWKMTTQNGSPPTKLWLERPGVNDELWSRPWIDRTWIPSLIFIES